MMRTMNILSPILGILAAAQAGVNSNQARKNDGCAQIYQRAIQHGNEHSVVVPGSLAYKCLQGLPFEPKRATAFIREMRKWVQFESDLEILKNPPAGYQMPSADIIGGLDAMESKAATGEYKSQFDFDSELKVLIASAYQGHFAVKPCSLSLFTFHNPASLVSISQNGTSLPELYMKDDAIRLKSHNENTVSPVRLINGQHPEDYLLKLPMELPSQDWDALYNLKLFSNPISMNANGVPGKRPGEFSRSTQWSGAAYILDFANGSSTTIRTVAQANKFTFRNSKEVYEGICLPDKNSSLSGNSSSSSVEPKPLPSGYPRPYIRDKYNQILGFFPNTSHLQDIGVLAVTSFDTTAIPSQQAEFNRIASEFVKQASSKGKKKIIIDVSGNGGGNVPSGQDLFRIFFPQTAIYAATRLRSHDALNLIGQATSTTPSSGQAGLVPFVWKAQVKPDQTHAITSWKDLYGPHSILGVNSSSLISYNLTAISVSDNPINGYGRVPANPAKALWKPEDIVLITDGICASTCSVFAALMKQEGVRTIAFGGRPQNRPMQGVGGTRGARAMELSVYGSIIASFKAKAQQSLNTSKPLLSEQQLTQWDQIVPGPIENLPLKLAGGSINLLNNYSPKDTQVPLQFVYEAAECRRFFTLENIFNQETVWASAADAMFDGGACVPGSTNATGGLFA